MERNGISHACKQLHGPHNSNCLRTTSDKNRRQQKNKNQGKNNVRQHTHIAPCATNTWHTCRNGP
jgi:hypothetical protein